MKNLNTYHGGTETRRKQKVDANSGGMNDDRESRNLTPAEIAKAHARKDENHNWRGKSTPRHKEHENFHPNSLQIFLSVPLWPLW